MLTCQLLWAIGVVSSIRAYDWGVSYLWFLHFFLKAGLQVRHKKFGGMLADIDMVGV